MSLRPPRLWSTVLVLSILSAVSSPAPAAAEREIAGILSADTILGKFFLPLKKTDVKLEVTAGLVSGMVTQVFENTSGCPLEAVYTFPLPSRATVTGMELIVGDRVIRSVVKEREEAKKTYEEAKKSGKKAALLEEERPNIFTASVANFLPGETVEITFTYLEPLEFGRDRYSINFPMVVGQRYVPYDVVREADGTETEVPAIDDADRINPVVLHPSIDPKHRLSLEVRIVGLPVDEIESTTHEIEIGKDPSRPGAIQVSLAEDVTVPDSDFHLDCFLAENTEPGLSVVSSFKDGWNYGLITVFPPIGPGPSATIAVPRDVIFLIDTSGSMSGKSILQAQAGLDRCLEMLIEGDRFTIVRFSSDYSSFSPDLVAARPDTLDDAREYIASLKADGGTEMQPALEYVLGRGENPGRMKIVVFLTDGDVGNEDSLIGLLQSRLGSARLFTFGIGSAPNEYLMRKMAERGRGESRFIRSEEDVGEVMDSFFKTLDAPVLTDINISWRDPEGRQSGKVEYYPHPPPDVFAGRPLQLRAAYPADFEGNLVISGLLDGEVAEYRYSFSGESGDYYLGIDRLFARSVVDELMFERLRAEDADEKEQLKDEIVAVSLDHQIVSPFTSRVAVEERVEKRADGELVTVRVPVPPPRGWGLSATASDTGIYLIGGVIALLSGVIIHLFRKRFSGETRSCGR